MKHLAIVLILGFGAIVYAGTISHEKLNSQKLKRTEVNEISKDDLLALKSQYEREIVYLDEILAEAQRNHDVRVTDIQGKIIEVDGLLGLLD